LLGSVEDDGGILSVVRQARDSDAFRHAVLVQEHFQQKRKPELRLERSRWLIAESDSHPRLFLRSALAIPGLLRTLRRGRYGLDHAHSLGGFAAALLLSLIPAGYPLIFTNHTYARRVDLYRNTARSGRMTSVVLTPAMANHYGLRSIPGQVEIIPACCDPGLFERPLQPPLRNTPRIRLVGVGNLVRWKKWNLVLDALARLPVPLRQRLHFTLWGPTPNDPDAKAFTAELKSMIGALGLAPYARLAGPTTDVRGAVESADVFVLPSTNEPCSVALMEALALGRHAVVSASGGNPDIVRNGITGRLFRPDDPEDLARQLAGLAEGDWPGASPEECRESVRHHSGTAVWARYDDLYRRLLARPARP
jgi:glycosyltransferase involved in cell wall biosynthesis